MTATTTDRHYPPHLPRTGLLPDPAPLYDRYAALYAAFRLHVFPDDRREVAAALDLPAARRFAEIGCGPGFYASTFAAEYPHLAVTGIDRAAKQLAIARRRAHGLTNVTFMQGDACMLNRWYGTFDRIVAPRLLMVVPQREQAVAEMRRALVPRGRLLLAEPLQPPKISLLALFQARTAMQHTHDGAPLRDHLFTATTFATLIQSQPWANVTLWQAQGHRYACCVK